MSSDDAIVQQTSDPASNNLDLSNKTIASAEKNFMNLSQVGSDSENLNDLGQLNRSTNNYVNL